MSKGRPTGRTGSEHKEVREPLVQQLLALGWSRGQMQFDPEWRVPKSPSEATKREDGQSFKGFPVDLVVFDTSDTHGQWQHVLMVFETKAPNKRKALAQLETYLSLEPRAKVGYWTNGKDGGALFRRADGTFKRVDGFHPPRPEDDLSQPASKPLTFKDLIEPNERELRSRFSRLLDSIVANDSVSTRSDDRLNELCNLLLVKLESDRRAKVTGQPVRFQIVQGERVTASRVRELFGELVGQFPTIFSDGDRQGLQLDDHTVHQVVYELSPLRLMDVSSEVVASAFQVFRSANLKAGEGQYFTPRRVIRSAIAFLDIAYEDKIIDPACGTGGFLLEAMRSLERKHQSSMSEADLRTWGNYRLFGVDKDSINVKLTRAVMQVVGDGSAHIHAGDSLRSHRWQRDYPHLPEPLASEQYTVVVTNPPFGRGLKISASDARAGHYSIAAASGDGVFKDLEIGLVFLERSYELLRTGGRLGIILPETYFFSSRYSWLMEWLEPRLKLKGILNIPMEAFQEFCRAKTNFYVFQKIGGAENA